MRSLDDCVRLTDPFVDRLFYAWDYDRKGALSFQDIVRGLDKAMFNDLMGNIAWFFNLHDNNKDGYCTKDEVLKISEALLVSITPFSHALDTKLPQFIFRNEPGDQYLAAVSRLMQNAFEFADNQQAEASQGTPSEPENLLDEAASEADKPTGSRRSTITERPATLPFLSLASFRMVVLADELLEAFFSEDLANCWHLEPLTEDLPPPKPSGATGRFANFVGSFMTDENKDYLSKLADDIGKKLDIQHVEQKPSLGRLTGAAAMQEPQERATLLSTSKSQSRQTSPLLPTSPYSAASMRQAVNLPPLTPPSLSVDVEKELASGSVPSAVAEAAEKDIVDKALPSAPTDQILGLGIMDERPRFAIDDAGDEDSDVEDDADVTIDDDAALMNGMSFLGGESFIRLMGFSTDVDAFLSSVDATTDGVDSKTVRGQ